MENVAACPGAPVSYNLGTESPQKGNQSLGGRILCLHFHSDKHMASICLFSDGPEVLKHYLNYQSEYTITFKTLRHEVEMLILEEFILFVLCKLHFSYSAVNYFESQGTSDTSLSHNCTALSKN